MLDGHSASQIHAEAAGALPPGALMLCPPRPPSRRHRRAREHAEQAGARLRTRCVLGVAALLAVVFALAGAPWLSLGAAGAGATQYMVAVGLMTRRAMLAERERWPYTEPMALDVVPQDIDATPLRISYHGIVRVHEEIRGSLVDAERLQGCLRSVYERCCATVHAAGRLARLANPLNRYLEEHDPARIEREIGRLATSSSLTDDPLATCAYGQAASARSRQLATYQKLRRLHERIAGRLELVGASLESIAAQVIELQVCDLEEAELAGESIAERLQVVDDELQVLTAMMDTDWDAPTSRA